MDNQSYYSILGLVPGAEVAVIKAAYRALAFTYHPDRNKEPGNEEKIKAINTAYATLSDPIKRAQYDKSLKVQQDNLMGAEFDTDPGILSQAIAQAWSVAVSFYPNIDKKSADLERISWRLSFSFKLKLLESQEFRKCDHIYEEMKENYLERFFGLDKNLQSYAEENIKSGHKDVALRINEIVRVMGKSVSLWQIKAKIESEFPDIQNEMMLRKLYQNMKLPNGSYDYAEVVEFILGLGGRVQRNFFWKTGRVKLTIFSENHEFGSVREFYSYVEKTFSHYS